jgi:hypothetical protein
MKQASETPKPTRIKKPRKDKESKTTEATPPAQTSEIPIQETQSPAPSTVETPQTPERETLTQSPEPFTAPITLESLQRQIDSLNVQLQELLARKRKPPVSSDRIQIKDKLTGQTFRSKNNAYQTLLKSGDLQSLIEKGVLGPIPEKNTFGWYVLAREFPDRFEEVKPENPTPGHE